MGAIEVAGADAIFLRMEDPQTPGHTLKIVLLDSARLGRPIALADLIRLAPAHLGLSPRLTQRPMSIGKRLFWVEDAAFDLTRHLDEHTLVAPTDAALDAFCESLTTRQLPRSRPLWSATLVHGLAGGRQALVLRVHHAIMDGLAAVNLLQALTTATPGEAPTPRTATADAMAVRAPASARVRTAARTFRESRRLRRSFDLGPDVPSGMRARSPFNRPSGAERRCASRTISFADLKAVAASSRTTLNGAFHAVLGQALRLELLERGVEPTAPLIATFGVVADATSDRCHGNDIATARVWMHAQESDPVTLAGRTAASCSQSVAYRRHLGFDFHRAMMETTDKLAPIARSLLAGVIPVVPNHITTANVPGPREQRWCGDVEIIGLTSYSLAIAPADVSITAYSYQGRMWLGLVTTPESMPDPAGFLDRVEQALADLVAGHAANNAAGQASASGRASASTDARSSASRKPAAIA